MVSWMDTEGGGGVGWIQWGGGGGVGWIQLRGGEGGVVFTSVSAFSCELISVWHNNDGEQE